ncbi:MAG: lipoyl(octanoyl) transferase LipB [Pseudomonadota bacterium]
MTDLVIRQKGLVEYQPTLAAMHAFTSARDETTADELWVLQHPRVFTQGQAGKPEHLLMPGDIPVVQTDRGGQVTYHGPGQLVIYPLIDIGRRGYGVRSLVSRLETAMIETLAAHGISAYADAEAPGVYVDIDQRRHKIGSLGLRVRQGRSLHGLSLNVAMDMEPFARINPCGYSGLAMTQMAALCEQPGVDAVGTELAQRLQVALI